MRKHEHVTKGRKAEKGWNMHRESGEQQKVKRESAPGLPKAKGGWPENPLGKPHPAGKIKNPNPGMGNIHGSKVAEVHVHVHHHAPGSEAKGFHKPARKPKK